VETDPAIKRVVVATRQSNVDRARSFSGTLKCDAGHTKQALTNGGIMDKRPKQDQGSSWNDENEKMTNPNRRQEEDQDLNVESPSGQRASRTDSGSSESPPSDRSDRDEQLHGDRQSDTSRRERQTEE
jgi:hypothetical protein